VKHPHGTIRALTVHDATTYTDMLLEAVREAPLSFGTPYEDIAGNPHLPAQVQRSLSQPTIRPVLCAFNEEGVPRGMITLERIQLTYMSHKASVLTLYVAPDARRQGIATALLHRLFVVARTMIGLEQVAVSVLSTNIPALSLYSNNGFIPAYVEERGIKYGEKYASVTHMLLDLSR